MSVTVKGWETRWILYLMRAVAASRQLSFQGRKICGFLGSDSEYVIPFSCIKKIGEDIIFVEICEEKYLVPCK